MGKVELDVRKFVRFKKKLKCFKSEEDAIQESEEGYIRYCIKILN